MVHLLDYIAQGITLLWDHFERGATPEPYHIRWLICCGNSNVGYIPDIIPLPKLAIFAIALNYLSVRYAYLPILRKHFAPRGLDLGHTRVYHLFYNIRKYVGLENCQLDFLDLPSSARILQNSLSYLKYRPSFWGIWPILSNICKPFFLNDSAFVLYSILSNDSIKILIIIYIFW